MHDVPDITYKSFAFLIHQLKFTQFQSFRRLFNDYNPCNLMNSPFKTCSLVSIHPLICPNALLLSCLSLHDIPGLGKECVVDSPRAGSLQMKTTSTFLGAQLPFEMLLCVGCSNVATNTVVPQFSILAFSISIKNTPYIYNILLASKNH